MKKGERGRGILKDRDRGEGGEQEREERNVITKSSSDVLLQQERGKCVEELREELIASGVHPKT